MFSLSPSFSLSTSLVVVRISRSKVCSATLLLICFSLSTLTVRSSSSSSFPLLSESSSTSLPSKSPSPIPDKALFLSCSTFTLYRLLPLILMVDNSTESIRFNSPILTNSVLPSSTLYCLLFRYSSSSPSSFISSKSFSTRLDAWPSTCSFSAISRLIAVTLSLCFLDFSWFTSAFSVLKALSQATQ